MKKITALLASTASAGLLLASANAATYTVSAEPLTATSPVGVEVDLTDGDVGMFSFEGSFDVVDVGLSQVLSLDITSSDGDLPRVLGMDVNLYSGSGGVGFLGGVTDFTSPATGVAEGPDNFLADFTGLDEVFFVVSGISEPSIGRTFSNINFDVAAVPLPAAAPLFAAGALGAFGLSRRKRKGVNA